MHLYLCSLQAIVANQKVKVNGDMRLAQPTIHLSVGGEAVTTQILNKRAGEITLLYKGTPFKVSE